jgi:energy-coupling factor transporter ATP-binding protein EcfA2
MTALLQTHDLTLAFGGLVVANGINFSLEQGERLAVIGQNGAGKTTFINICTGLLKPTLQPSHREKSSDRAWQGLSSFPSCSLNIPCANACSCPQSRVLRICLPGVRWLAAAAQ